jgi:imidazolonepropionase-like amidohydrolase
MKKRHLRPFTLLISFILFLTFPILSNVSAQERPTAFTNAKILTMAGETIEGGTLLIENGKIVAVGLGISIPPDADIRDVAGMVVMPGIVDTHSHIGQVAGADRSGPIQPEVRAWDAINPLASSIARARAGGVTTANVMPGSGHLVSGQTFYMKLRLGTTIEDISFLWTNGSALGGMKMANGTNSIRGEGGFPGTRAKSASLLRSALSEAKTYCNDSEREIDLANEALCQVLSGRRLVHFHSHRADDIMTVLRLQREFGFQVLIQHGMESWKIAEELASSEIPVSLILVDSPGGKLEAQGAQLNTAAILEKAGVLVSLHSDDSIIDSRFMFRHAAIAVRGGMTREGAMRALTINGAVQMGIDDRVGSLEVGKDADFLILNGDPLSVYTQLIQTWVEGENVFDRSREEDLLLAQGGYGAGNPREAAHYHWELQDAEISR